jgi:glycosyltransferase involved in cell wall biosynthesis
MKIGLNGQKILIKDPAGPEVYTINTFKALARLDTQNQYIVYFTKEPTKDFWQELSQGNANFSYKVLKKNISWTHLSLGIELIKNPVDVFFAATHTIPITKLKKTKYVSMIHGLEYKANRQFYKSPLRFLLQPIILWFVLLFSKIIIVPSVATRDAILSKRWPFLKAHKVRVIYEGVNESFYHREKGEVEKIRKKYQLGQDPYLFFVSTIQPRKNIPAVIEAFSLATEENKGLKNLKLVISGKKGWLYEKSLEAPEKYGVSEKVLFLGRTPDEDLPVLFSGAEYFINCSLEEGFGIPLLEAMACETPAIVSNIPAFRELGRNFPIYVDPKKVISIKKGILKAMKNPADKSTRLAAREISQQYTWENGAQQLISVFESFFKHL